MTSGLPHHSFFPYDTLEAATALPQRFTPTPNQPESDSASDPTPGNTLVPDMSGAQDVLRKISHQFLDRRLEEN